MSWPVWSIVVTTLLSQVHSRLYFDPAIRSSDGPRTAMLSAMILAFPYSPYRWVSVTFFASFGWRFWQITLSVAWVGHWMGRGICMRATCKRSIEKVGYAKKADQRKINHKSLREWKQDASSSLTFVLDITSCFTYSPSARRTHL